jgi:hypothetical protein
VDRGGTEIGPPLVGLDRHWTADTLVQYIGDPARFRDSDERLQALVIRYNGRLMKPFRLPRDEARTLARWLLADEDDAP